MTPPPLPQTNKNTTPILENDAASIEFLRFQDFTTKLCEIFYGVTASTDACQTACFARCGLQAESSAEEVHRRGVVLLNANQPKNNAPRPR
jgi:hypothetical protein